MFRFGNYYIVHLVHKTECNTSRGFSPIIFPIILNKIVNQMKQQLYSKEKKLLDDHCLLKGFRIETTSMQSINF